VSVDISKLGEYEKLGRVEGVLDPSGFTLPPRRKTVAVAVAGGMALVDMKCECRLTDDVSDANEGRCPSSVDVRGVLAQRAWFRW